MKKSLLFLTIILFSLILNAQVGVKTENPQGVFHIDGQGNTSGSSNIADDIVVTSSGNMGIGTNAPATKVDIRTTTAGGGFRLQDGTQGFGKSLISDGVGNATWQMPGVAYAKLGNIPASEVIHPVFDASVDNLHVAYSGMSIELDPGDYQVNFTVWGAPVGDVVIGPVDYNRFASVFFSTSATANVPPTYLSPIRSVIIPRLYNDTKQQDYYGSGSIPVRVATKTTLYLWFFMHRYNWNGPDKRIRSANRVVGGYGPYCQLYAIPFSVNE